jgi:hypothetical protein
VTFKERYALETAALLSVSFEFFDNNVLHTIKWNHFLDVSDSYVDVSVSFFFSRIVSVSYDCFMFPQLIY